MTQIEQRIKKLEAEIGDPEEIVDLGELGCCTRSEFLQMLAKVGETAGVFEIKRTVEMQPGNRAILANGTLAAQASNS